MKTERLIHLLRNVESGKITVENAEMEISGWVDELSLPTRTPVDGEKPDYKSSLPLKAQAAAFITGKGLRLNTVLNDELLVDLLTDFASRKVSVSDAEIDEMVESEFKLKEEKTDGDALINLVVFSLRAGFGKGAKAMREKMGGEK